MAQAETEGTIDLARAWRAKRVPYVLIRFFELDARKIFSRGGAGMSFSREGIDEYSENSVNWVRVRPWPIVRKRATAT